MLGELDDNAQRRNKYAPIKAANATARAKRRADRAAGKVAEKATRQAAREAARPSEEERRLRKRESKRRERERYYALHPEKKKIQRVVRKARQRAAEKRAAIVLTPDEKKKVSALYVEARQRTRDTGYQWDVHHIKALAEGGLHHPDNLEVVPADINNAIGTRTMTALDYLLT